MNHVHIEPDVCKGCRVCVETCPNQCIVIGSHFNTIGYQHAVFRGRETCTACGMCFYVCPEPGAITVLRDIDPDADSGLMQEASDQDDTGKGGGV